MRKWQIFSKPSQVGPTSETLLSLLDIHSISAFRPASSPDPLSRESLQPIADHILRESNVTPVLGLVCGSGLGSLAALVEESVTLPYSSIPHFPVSTAPGHQGRLVMGRLGGLSVVMMQGRLHVYEVSLPHWTLDTCTRDNT